jgi:hypothetical protein
MTDLTNEKPLSRETLGGDLGKGWDATDRLPARIAQYATLKERTKEFIDWGLQGGISLFDKPTTKTFRALQDCGQYLIFRNYIISKRARLIGACSCKQHLLCAFCASRRGVKNAVAYKEKVDYLAQESQDPLDLVFITFTIKNGPDLLERFEHLRNSIQTILKRRNNQRLANRVKYTTEMYKLTGGVFAYEFKRGANLDQWHPHVHMLAHLPKDRKIDVRTLKDEWKAITGDSSVINIEYVNNDNPYLEIFAYALKFSEMEHADRWFAAQRLRAQRLISSFGSFRGVDLTDDVTDDVLTTDEPFVDLLFRWHATRRSYLAGVPISPPDLQAVA